MGFEPTISAGERPYTYALDRAATGTGYDTVYLGKWWSEFRNNLLPPSSGEQSTFQMDPPPQSAIVKSHLSVISGQQYTTEVVEALGYKLAGRGFDSPWCHWNFSVT